MSCSTGAQHALHFLVHGEGSNRKAASITGLQQYGEYVVVRKGSSGKVNNFLYTKIYMYTHIRSL